MPMPKRGRANAAANLDHFYDDLMAGEPAPRSEIDPELASLATRLYRTGCRSAAPHAFKQQLWEDLMQSSGAVPAQSGFTGVRPPIPSAIGRQPVDQLSSAWRGLPRSVLLQAAVAALLLVGLLAAFRPGFDQGGGPELSLNAPLFGSPATAISERPSFTRPAEVGPVAKPEDCTTHVLRLIEIGDMLDAAFHDVPYHGGAQRPTGVEMLTLQQTPVKFEDGATVDPKVVAEIEPVYNMYYACSSAGSIRQQYYLMTPSGIVQTLMHSSSQIGFRNIAALGVPPTPFPEEYPVHIPAITATQQLEHGRIAIQMRQQFVDGSESPSSIMIFRHIDGSWYIDEWQCGWCG